MWMDKRKTDRHKKRSGDRHTTRHRTKFTRGNFCAWDGEGATVASGKHEYIMLISSKGHEHRNYDGISTLEAFDTLLSAAQELPPDTIHVMFSAGYDINMILRDMPHDKIAELWNTVADHGGVDWEVDGLGFNLYYRHRKEFCIRQYIPAHKYTWKTHKAGKNAGKRYRETNYIRSIVLWDVFGFFQTSYVATLKKWLKDIIPQDELDMIIQNKKDRSIFRVEDANSIAHYCKREVYWLEQIMIQLHKDLQEAGLKINRWDGPGAIAAALLKKYKVADHKAVYADESQAAGVKSASRYAYAGGRIELFKLGHSTDTLYHYDINSAYPAAMVDLPCLRHGTWKYTQEYKPDTFSIWEVAWDYHMVPYEHPMPFFWRSKQGRIYYPPAGRGMYWQPEIQAALDHKPDGAILRIKGGWVFTPQCTHKPFAFVADIYKQRQQWVKEGKSAEKVLKLGLNSLYGKLAQRVGATPPTNDNGEWAHIPVFHELNWAGWITSSTRAKLYAAAMQDADGVVMMMTDGITTHKPLDLPTTPGDKKLGEWEDSIWEETYTIQAGIYFVRYDTTKWDIKYRGFDQGQLSPDIITEAWKNKEEDLQLTSTRFVTMGSCVSTGDFSKWRSWPTTIRECRVYPDIDPHKIMKRMVSSVHSYKPPWDKPQHGFIPLLPMVVNANDLSSPHSIPWENIPEYNEDYIDGVPSNLYDKEMEDSYE